MARHKCVVYVPNDQTIQQLTSFISPTSGEEEGQRKVMVVTGPSGSGKSSLIAYWWLSVKCKILNFLNIIIYYQKNRLNFLILDIDTINIPVFVHFIGSSLLASDFFCMVQCLFRRINSVILAHSGSALSLPETDDVIAEHMSLFLQEISKHTVCLLSISSCYYLYMLNFYLFKGNDYCF